MTATPIRSVSDIARGLPVTIDDGTRKYVYGLGLAYAVSGTTIEVYHPDRLGSTRAITDAAGAVTATYRTDEWGIPTATTGSSSQPFRFTGEPQDATGLTYLRARYYDPGLGRFTSRDRLSGRADVPQSLDRYAYAIGNPLRYIDPSGLAQSNVLRGPDLGTTLLGIGALLGGGAICVLSGVCEAAAGAVVAGGASEIGTGVILDIITPEVEGGTAAAEALTSSEAQILIKIGERVSSGLKADAYHLAPAFVVDDIANSGTVFRIVGNDGVSRTLVQMLGEVSGVAGRYEWILNDAGQVTHEEFIPGGAINGIPITP